MIAHVDLRIRFGTGGHRGLAPAEFSICRFTLVTVCSVSLEADKSKLNTQGAGGGRIPPRVAMSPIQIAKESVWLVCRPMMDVDDSFGENPINLTTEEELDIVEGPSEKVASELGAHVHLFASLFPDRPLASLNEPLLMNLTEDGLESAIEDTVSKFDSFAPMQLAARVRSMQNWAVTLARDEGTCFLCAK